MAALLGGAAHAQETDAPLARPLVLTNNENARRDALLFERVTLRRSTAGDGVCIAGIVISSQLFLASLGVAIDGFVQAARGDSISNILIPAGIIAAVSTAIVDIISSIVQGERVAERRQATLRLRELERQLATTR